MRIGRHILSLAVVVLGFLAACIRHGEGTTILPRGLALKDGDVVFRRGTGVTSRMVCAADIGGLYSHVGLVVATDSGLMVAHAVPDEPDYPGDIDRVKLEEPEEFFSTFRAQRGAVARCCDSVAAGVASRYALLAYERRTPFDHNYDDADTTSLYCCELVARAYHSAGVELVDTVRHHVCFPGVIDAVCMFPSDIFNAAPLHVEAEF